MDTMGVILERGCLYKGSTTGTYFSPSMRKYCGQEVILQQNDKYNILVEGEDEYIIETWMCSAWNEMDSLEEEFNNLGEVSVSEELSGVVTVSCNYNSYKGLRVSDEVIYLEIADVNNSLSAGLTPLQWKTLNDQAIKIIELKERVSEMEE